MIALLGTGLATVALGLLAYDLAGANAGAVLGGALAIKMIAYIGVGPVVNAFIDHIPRRTLLVAMDVVRAIVALSLPFADQVWQVYVLIFLLQSASAAFTPTFQAAIPDVLPDEQTYTRALSLSRLAYDLESLVSPMLAAALLTLISFHWLFAPDDHVAWHKPRTAAQSAGHRHPVRPSTSRGELSGIRIGRTGPGRRG